MEDQHPTAATTSVTASLEAVLAQRQGVLRQLQRLAPAEQGREHAALSASLQRLTRRHAALLARLADAMPPHHQPLGA